ncbi:MAG: hypothetical protein E6K82_18475, partial [Candidatus Rokuibacteriota bacterium]
DVELVPLQSLPALSDALTARRVDAVMIPEPFVSRLEAAGAGRTIVNTGDAFPWQSAVVMYSDRFAKDRPAAVAFMQGYVKASRHYFDAVLAKKGGSPYDEVVAITAKYTGAPPELIRKGFPYQDRDARLMPGDVGRSSSSPTAARSRCASSARAGSSASRRSPCSPRRTARRSTC